MSATSMGRDSAESNTLTRQLTLVQGWHSVVALVALGGAFLVFTGALPAWARVLTTVLLLLLALSSAAAVLDIRRRRHSGRTLSLFINYLSFVTCLLGLLHVTGVFVGLDSLANTIGRGLPFLFVAFLGYLIGAFGDRYEHDHALELRFRRVGRWIMLLSSVAALFAIGIVPGVVYFVRQLAHPTSLLLLMGVVLCLVFIRLMWQQAMGEVLGARTQHEAMLNGYLYLSPNLLGFLLFFAGPLLLSFYVSFTDWDAFGTRNWIGLANYAEIFRLDIARLASPAQRASEVLDLTIFDELARFTLAGRSYVIGAADKLFWIALRNTLTFTLFAVPISVSIALLLANLLNTKIPGIKFFRAVYFLPSIAAIVGISLVWQWLYNSTVGFINYFILNIVTWINNLFGAALVDPQIRWLSESRTALLAIIIMAAWQTIGFNTVLFLAGLQNIPGVLYEAATVDGAGRWARFRNVTIPMLAPTTFFVVTTTTIRSFQVFEEVYILTNPVGGPNNSTLTLVVYLYQNGFQFFKQGYASAIAWVLFIVIFGVTLAQFKRQQSGGAYEA